MGFEQTCLGVLQVVKSQEEDSDGLIRCAWSHLMNMWSQLTGREYIEAGKNQFYSGVILLCCERRVQSHGEKCVGGELTVLLFVPRISASHFQGQANPLWFYLGVELVRGDQSLGKPVKDLSLHYEGRKAAGKWKKKNNDGCWAVPWVMV